MAAIIELERLESRLRTVQLAVEILTGLCANIPYPCLDDTGGGENERTEGQAPSSFRSITAAPDEGMALDEQPLIQSSRVMLLPGLVEYLLPLIHPTPLSFPPFGGASIQPPITSVLSDIHISALEALNNILLSFSIIAKGTITIDEHRGARMWQEIWSALGAVGTEAGRGQEKRREVWENAVGVLWGIASIWKGILVSVGSGIFLCAKLI